MTFMRKIMDLFNMDNWYRSPDHRNTQSNYAKWSSIRDEKEMEIERNTMDLKNVMIYFKDGIITDVIPNVYDYYKAQYFNINGKTYDTYSVESVQSIPKFDFSNRKSLGTPVYYLEYILRMRASQERIIHNNVLAYALLRKSTQLMENTGNFYNSKDFLRLANWLYQDGKYEQAKTVEKELLSIINNTMPIHLEAFQQTITNCKQLHTDYVICPYSPGTCQVCASYQTRVYCISGRDKRFPKLPDIVYQYGGFHNGCRHTFYPFILGVSSFKNQYLQDCEPIKYSNRPFIDDRSDSDKQLYLQRIENQKKHEEAAMNKRIYYDLMQKIPEVMPKSVTGFTKMKRANSINYQKIVKAAHDIGIEI